MSIENTRLSNRAQVQFGEVAEPSGSSTPCWRGVGMMAARKWLCGAKHPRNAPDAYGIADIEQVQIEEKLDTLP